MTTIISALTATLTFMYGVEIDPNVVSQIPFDSPIFDWLEAGPGAPHRDLARAATYGVLSAAAFSSGTDGSFACGGDPPDISLTRAVEAVTKKCYGAQSGIADVNIIASRMGIAPHSLDGEGYRDDAELLLNMLYVRTRQAIDWAIIRGSVAANANNFNGLENRVTALNGSEVLAVNGVYTKSALDELIIQMMMKGVTPQAICCNPIVLSSLTQAYTSGATNVDINMNMGDGAATLGYWVKDIVTPAGVLPIITDRRFTVAGTAPTFTTDIYVLTREHMGEQILKLQWQVLPTALDLARLIGYYTSQIFAVWSNVALIEKSSWFAQGKLDNVIITYAPTPATVAV